MKKIKLISIVLLTLSMTFVSFSKTYAQDPGGSKTEIVLTDTNAVSPENLQSDNPVVDTAFISAVINYYNSVSKDPDGFLGVGWNWIHAVYLFLYLLVGLLFPTTKEYDFVLWPLKIVQWIIANRKADGGTHVRTLWQTFRK